MHINVINEAHLLISHNNLRNNWNAISKASNYTSNANPDYLSNMHTHECGHTLVYIPYYVKCTLIKVGLFNVATLEEKLEEIWPLVYIVVI